jgi:hypothetical protein
MATGADPDTFLETVHGVCEQMAGLLYTGSVFDNAEVAAAGSNIFNPVDWDPISATSGISFTAASNPASNFLQWGARAPSSGKRAKLYLLQPIALANSKMRFQTGDDSRIDLVTDALVEAADIIGNVAGEFVVWKTYANAGENDHLTHTART